MKNFLLVHPFCFANNTIVKTDKSFDKLNKIIYLIQYIESDLPSVETEGDGIYQTDLKIILSEFFNLETEEHTNQDIDYEINILDNWESNSNTKKELYELAYKDGLELYLIDYRLAQIKTTESKDFEIFTAIKTAVLSKDEDFYWKGWCGRDYKINYKDFLNLKN